ncbi:MAG: GNAT family N-acetyltransferase [Nocardiopsaceae bacterium]|jgi:GNAT superfamily N-acetyltransferase|nr:GNAT family N-acetyltransferase [Nocardiopsaceae bacterium]
MSDTDARIATDPEDFRAAAELLVDFNAEYNESAPASDFWARHIALLCADGVARVYLIGRPARGFAVLRLRTSTYEEALEGYLAEMYVVPDHRGRGLGTILLQAVIDDARAVGATYLDLTTTQADKSAIALYEKFGFDCHEGKGSGPLSLYYELDL